MRENWYRDVWLFLITVVVFLALTSAQSATNATKREVITRTDTDRAESLARADQFCHLINSTHRDRVARYQNTVIYLRSPAGKERTLLNMYIRKVSLPQSLSEIRREAKVIPRICRGKP